MRHQNVFPLLAFAITLGFLVVRVEEAKQQQLEMLGEFALLTKDNARDAEIYPELIAERRRSLGIDYPSITNKFNSVDAIPSVRFVLDPNVVYKNYLSSRDKLDQYAYWYDLFPVPKRESKTIALLENPKEEYFTGELIEAKFRILHVPTAKSFTKPPLDVKTYPSIEGATIPLMSKKKLSAIEVIYENPVTKEKHVYKTKFE